MPPPIVVLDSLPFNPGDLDWAPLAALGELTLHEQTPPELTAARLATAEVTYTNKVRITADVLAAAPRLRLISVLATGHDNVDSAAARARGIPVCNVPAYSSESVVQATFALLLELTNHVGRHDDLVHRGRWQEIGRFCFWETPLHELAGKRLLIVGLGTIGRRVAQVADAFGLRVAAAQLPGRPADGPWPRLPLEAGLAAADVITLHCPLTPNTRHLMNAERLALVKPGALLLNTGRGLLVDDAAVAAALHAGRLGGYAADVTYPEPPAADNPLLTAPNCVLTPHHAWATLEARQRLMAVSVENLRAFLAGRPQNVINGVAAPRT